jgi:hypothetical protein
MECLAEEVEVALEGNDNQTDVFGGVVWQRAILCTNPFNNGDRTHIL